MNIISITAAAAGWVSEFYEGGEFLQEPVAVWAIVEDGLTGQQRLVGLKPGDKIPDDQNPRIEHMGWEYIGGESK